MRTVAFLGLGIMGWPMARNLTRAGYELRVWTRTREKAERFAREHRASAHPTPAAAAENADAVVTMLPDAPEVEEALLGPAGAASTLAQGAIAIDCSTIGPTAARRIGDRLAALGIAFCDAPVTGSRPRAEAATLTFMVGGDSDVVARVRPLLEAMGELIVHVGGRGHGAFAKVIANTVTAINAAAVGEALATVQAAGIDPQRWLEVARAGSSGSQMLELKAPAMLARDYTALFRLRHMLKDLRHYLDEAHKLGLEPALARTAEQLYERALALGLGDQDFAAVAEVAGRARSAPRRTP